MEFKMEWITTPQAMQILHFTSRTSVYKYALKHGIRVSKPMGTVYYNLPDIIATIERYAVKMGV